MFKKKEQYENIYEWAESEDGTCFYCKEDKPVAEKLIGDKGICKECLDAFEIGHIGADHTLLGIIMPTFCTYWDAEKWLNAYGAGIKMVDILDYDADETICIYHQIRDKAAYEAGIKGLIAGSLIDGLSFMESYNTVEISLCGNVHILY